MNSAAMEAKPRIFWLRVVAVFLVITGVVLAVGGVKLVTLGGTPYYLLAGMGLLVSGWLIWQMRVGGVWLYLALFGVTLAWSLWESGLDGWALLPRLGYFIVLGIGLLAAWWRALRPVSALLPVGTLLLGAGVLAIAASALLPSHGDAFVDQQTAPPIAATPDDGEWRHIGRTASAQRFSPLQQLTPANVAKLEVAWQVHLGMPPTGTLGLLEASPLKVGDTLYMCNAANVVIALDAETGATRWRFDPEAYTKYSLAVCRGVAYYRVPEASGSCSERIISFSKGSQARPNDARMFALDAHTGQRCPGFGVNGEVSLLEGMGTVEIAYYNNTSAPTIVRGKIIVGGAVKDGQEVNEPPGVIRGFDAVTGKFLWAWDMGRPGEHGLPPPGTSYTRGTPNVWAPMTGDEQLGLVYLPLGNATPDYVAAHRTPAMNKYASSVVALDVETGDVRWSYQTVHRDVWDYDLASQPTLVDFPTAEGVKPALIQTTKTAQIFVLDRRTGEPLVQVEERPVPQKTVPGEQVAPTQPYSVGMPSFSEPLHETDMWGITLFDQLWCRIKFRDSQYEGDFTPVTDQPTIVYPGYFGGFNWAGVSIDPERMLMVVNPNHYAMRDRLMPRAEADRLGLKPLRAGSSQLTYTINAQAGTAYAAEVNGFFSPIGTLCIKPPYGEIAAVDLKTRKTVWRQPLGTGRDTGPFDIPSLLPIRMGVPMVGGTLVTRSGLIFVAATQEKSFRAIDLKTGRELWQARLPVGGHANPITYYSERSGRQFVVMLASGSPMMKNGSGDFAIAYALPKK